MPGDPTEEQAPAGRYQQTDAKVRAGNEGGWTDQRRPIDKTIATLSGIVATAAAVVVMSGCGDSGRAVKAGVPGPDRDCVGGSGDGPRYVQGPIQVGPNDPHRLDADNDGVGCE